MRAVVIQEDRSLAVQEVDEPQPGPGQVRVRVDACGICGSDIHMLPSPMIPAGQIMGHEFSGVIDAIGPDVDSHAEGDQVCVYPFKPLDHHDLEAAMTSGIGTTAGPGGYAEAACVPADMVWKLPEGMPVEQGALVEPLAVAVHSLRVGGVQAGDACAVIGAGPIGVMHAIALGALGVENLVVIERNAERRARVEDLGFRALDTEGAGEAVLAALGEPPAKILECAGHPSAPPLALELLAVSGTIVLAGMTEEPVALSQLMVMMKEARLLGSFAYLPPDFDEALELIAAGRVPVEKIVTSREPLEQAAAMFDELIRPGTTHLKILLKP